MVETGRSLEFKSGTEQVPEQSGNPVSKTNQKKKKAKFSTEEKWIVLINTHICTNGHRGGSEDGYPGGSTQQEPLRFTGLRERG